MEKRMISWFMMVLVIIGGFAPFATAQLTNPSAAGFTGGSYGGITNTYQSSRPSFGNFYSGSRSTYWPILNRLQKDQCDAVNSDFIIGIPPGGCSPIVVRSDLLAEQNVPVFCQLSAIRVNPLIDVSTIKSISFKGNYPKEVAGISFHPARAAVRSYRTLLGDPIEENIGYVVIVLKQQPDERNLEEYISGMLTATVRYNAQGAFGTGAAEYYLDVESNDDWKKNAAQNSFWAGKGYLRVKNVDENEATIEILSDRDNVYRTVTLKEGETSNRIYMPGQYCTAAMKLRLNKIDNSADMARVNIDGDTFWVRKGSKLLGGKCVVRDLNVFPGSSGTVEISCSGNSRFTLVLGDSGVSLKIGEGENVKVGIGGSLKVKVGKKDKDIYLGYYGEQNKVGKFAILFNKSLSEDDVSLITGIFDIEEFNDEGDIKAIDKMKASLDSIKSFENKFEIVKEGESGYGITVVSVGLDSVVAGYGDTFIPGYLNQSKNTVLSLVKDYPSEKKENDEYFGEEALYKQVELAGRAKDEGMQVDLIKKFLAIYPGSDSVEYMRDLKLKIEQFDGARSSVNVFVNNNDYNIRVDGFAPGTGASDSVTLWFAGGVNHAGLKRGRVYDVNTFEEITNNTLKTTKVPRLTIVDIDGNSAKISYTWNDTERKKVTTSSATIKKGDTSAVGGVQIKVVDTKVREVAYVSLIPEVRNTKTEANFTFNIGIEKRAFELSPEKAQLKIDRLSKSIAEWESKIEKLGKLVKGMKAACLATSTILTLKNFIAGFSGAESIARKAVMDEYEKKCKAKGYKENDMHECFSVYNQQGVIERDIDAYGAAITGVNSDVRRCTEGSAGVKSEFLKTEVVNNEKYVNSLRDCANGVDSKWYVNISGTVINKANLTDSRDYQAVMTYERSCASEKSVIDKINAGTAKVTELSVACQIARNKLTSTLGDNIDRIEALKLTAKAKSDLGVPLTFTSNVKGKNSYAAITDKAHGKIAKGAIVSGVEYNGRKYYVEVDKTGFATKVYTDAGVEVTSKFGDDYANVTMNKAYDFIVPTGKEDSCSNLMNTPPYVRYYESGNKQGFAAVVPVDKSKGWYAYVDNDYYASSGIPSSFEICNVGRDGDMGEGSKSGDICQLFQASSAGSVSTFIPCTGMSSSEVKRLYDRAANQIRKANRNGNGVDVDGEFAHKTTPLGPASSGARCTDFMTFDDCSLMFNVCDPVICPTSRCDLGGTFPVSDVIASGIVGSVALCLPNFGSPADGKVLIPVCLSGIHAGLDTYVSILKSHKQCLEENVETGRYTGICDEITAIYTCEFFWGQFAPILDTLLVRFVEGLYGGFQTKGGAEYLTVSESFKNLDNSIDYFRNNYMQNSLRAFNVRSTEEIGSTVCKGFVGSSVPTSASMIDSLLEPESPAQFTAYFSEDLFSDATVPSTSHYKVFYHIYAGNDRGAQYRVYLKSPPESSYYATRQTLLVDSGFATKGVAASESIDFTAPSGYQELCVSINGNDECGFGKVSSSFAVNYAAQAYVADQATDKNIKGTENCVTTSTSAWALVNPNIQAGVEDALGQDDIATTGIIRICASINPDKGVVAGNDVYCDVGSNSKDKDGVEINPKCSKGYSCVGKEGSVAVCKNPKTKVSQVSQGNWIDVGECDTPEMRCWLDARTVKENLGQYMAVNNLTVNQLVRESEDLKELDEQYKNVREKLNKLREDVKGLRGKKVDALIDGKEVSGDVVKIIKGLNEVAGVGKEQGQGSNAAKAKALAMKATVYGIIVDKLIEVEAKKSRDSTINKPTKVSDFSIEGILDDLFAVSFLDVNKGDILKDEDGIMYEVVSSVIEGPTQVIELSVLPPYRGEDKTIKKDPLSSLSDSGYERVETSGEVVGDEEVVYVVSQGGTITDLYFKYVSGSWEWSPDEENWMKVPETKVSGGDYDGLPPNIKNIQIIASLDKTGADLEAGKEILKKGSVKVSEK